MWNLNCKQKMHCASRWFWFSMMQGVQSTGKEFIPLPKPFLCLEQAHCCTHSMPFFTSVDSPLCDCSVIVSLWTLRLNLTCGYFQARWGGSGKRQLHVTSVLRVRLPSPVSWFACHLTPLHTWPTGGQCVCGAVLWVLCVCEVSPHCIAAVRVSIQDGLEACACKSTGIEMDTHIMLDWRPLCSSQWFFWIWGEISRSTVFGSFWDPCSHFPHPTSPVRWHLTVMFHFHKVTSY